jgi:hypothetical protein
MFLYSKIRRKDGNDQRSWSVEENPGIAGGRVVQRHVLYLREINATQEPAWRHSIEGIVADIFGRAPLVQLRGDGSETLSNRRAPSHHGAALGASGAGDGARPGARRDDLCDQGTRNLDRQMSSRNRDPPASTA